MGVFLGGRADLGVMAGAWGFTDAATLLTGAGLAISTGLAMAASAAIFFGGFLPEALRGLAPGIFSAGGWPLGNLGVLVMEFPLLGERRGARVRSLIFSHAAARLGASSELAASRGQICCGEPMLSILNPDSLHEPCRMIRT